MPIPDSIVELVARYKENRAGYHSGHYNETQTRIDFVNPLFAALGWDMDNHAGLPEAYREVIHEAAIKIGGATKAPDYSFGVGGRRKFFLETKKPTVVLNLKLEPAYQLRRYAWTAKMPVSILTNFEEFVIYDGRVPPDQKDSPKKARLDYFKYTDYPDKWDELAARFSQPAVLSGDFDKYAEEAALFKASTPVDAAFLSQISEWREKLARNIALNNSGLAPRQLNYAVQMIIDRIIFLRICEDRGIETLDRLRGVTTGTGTYARLQQIFHQADERYNSGLFHFKKEKDRDDFDDVTPKLTIDDRLLKEIIAGIYFPESPFEFSVFPADILGQVYEQFLGKVIQVEGKTAVVEDKPEVKKAGGVYYTPTYIVDYIVRQTVGKLVEGKTPKQVSALRVLDPACGSGSFLIGAYQFLLDWHTHWYLEDDAAKWQKGKAATIYQAKGGVWRLTTAERRRILLNNLYGVDIDTQAVEVTKLSLLLKVLEGEFVEVLDHTLKLYHERALPDLETNIKCGNSLIGPDFYADPKMAELDTETQLRVNAFDWQREFREVMKAAGFDAVIGNPPYIRIQTLSEWAPWDAEFYKKAYLSAGKGNYDIYVVFVEKGLSLMNGRGRLGYILPHKFFNAQYGEPLRKIISQGGHLEGVTHFGDCQIFAEATTYTTCLFLTKARTDTARVSRVVDLDAWRLNGEAIEGTASAASLTASAWNFSIGTGADLFTRLQQMPVKLKNIAGRMAQGIRTSANEVYVLDLVADNGKLIEAHSKQLKANVVLERKAVSLFLQGREIKPYQLLSSGKVVIVPYANHDTRATLIEESKFKRSYPSTYKYLFDNKAYLEQRERGKMEVKDWYAYVYPKNLDVMSSRKILVPDIADRAAFALDDKGEYAFTSGYGITLKSDVPEAMEYVLGLLNSKVLDFFLKRVSTTMRGGFFRYFTQFIEQLPIRTINFDDPADKARHDKMVSLVEKMLTLNKELPGKTGQEKTVMQRQIEATDRQIDALAYELYGLTKDEIKIVEGQSTL